MIFIHRRSQCVATNVLQTFQVRRFGRRSVISISHCLAEFPGNCLGRLAARLGYRGMGFKCREQKLGNPYYERRAIR